MRSSSLPQCVHLAVACLALSLAGIPGIASAQAIQPSFDTLRPGESIAETYELNALGIVNQSQRGLWGPTTYSWRMVRGKYREPLGDKSFFLTLGRADLVHRQATREAWSTVLDWTGCAMDVAGIILLFYGFGQKDGTLAASGLGLMAGGTTAVVVGEGMTGTIVTEDEARGFATTYNALLRRKLGLADAPRTGVISSPWGRLTLVPVVRKAAFGVYAVAAF